MIHQPPLPGPLPHGEEGTKRRQGRRCSAGFTLLELVLAMAVMATIAAIAWPHLQPGVSRAAYRSAALQLKADFAEAREEAIHDGCIREFRFLPNTGRYVITPANFLADAESKSRSDRQRRAASGAIQTTEETADFFRELPGEIVFREPRRESDRRIRAVSTLPPGRETQSSPAADVKTERLEDVLNPENTEWVMSIRFFPDGRATDGMIDLEGQDLSREMSVHVRGLTGGVSIGPVVMIDQEFSGKPSAGDRSSSSAPMTERRP